MRMLWSWCPWVAIMTSASSSTKTSTFDKSKHLSFVPQSSILPGVPKRIWSVNWVPRETNQQVSQSGFNYFSFKVSQYCKTFTFFTTYCKPYFYLWAELSHFFGNFSSLDGQLKCRGKANHMGVVFTWICPAQHGEDKGSGFSSARLWLGNHILRPSSRIVLHN